VYGFEQTGPVRRAVRLAVTSRPVAALSARFLPTLDRLSARLSGGRVVFSAWATGLPVVELRTVGARSGEPRPVRLLGVPDGDGVVVIAANFGRTRHPAWYHNLRARPAVEVVVGDVRRSLVARELFGTEREAEFARAVAMNPGWRRFRDRAGPRDIPVLRLSAP
jgi:deazaflavin-dependent oxidoreductase (nitroreductase family)